MRLCLVVEAAAGGTGRHVIDLTRAMVTRGHDLTLVYSPLRADRSFTEALPALGANVVPLAMPQSIGWRDLGAARALSRVVRTHGPFAIVHAHSSKAGAVTRLAAVGAAALVYTPHALATLDRERGVARRALVELAERLLGPRTDALILVSEAEFGEAARLRLANDKRHLIANRLYGFAPVDRACARAALGADEDEQWIGFIGRLDAQKAPLQFVAAALAAMKRQARVRALILGDGSFAPVVAEAIVASEFADRFTWHRDRTAAELVAALDLLVVTSRFEGFPYVMLEALGAGVPVLSTDVGGARDLLGRGAGLVVPDERLAMTLMRLLADRPGLAAMQVAAARAGGLCRETWMFDETEALYQQLASR